MKIRLTVETGFVGCDYTEEIDVTDEDLRDTTLDEFCEDWIETMIANHISGGWEVIG